MAVTYEPKNPEVIEDPYPVYRSLREHDPVHWSADLNAWVLTRYRDVKAALHDPRLSSDRLTAFWDKLPAPMRAELADLEPLLGAYMNFTDPPKHTRLRALVGKAFTSRAIAALEPRIAALVDGMLAGVRDELDVIGRLAAPLPLRVIGDMLGVSTEDAPQLRQWSHDMAALIGGALRTPNKLSRAMASLRDVAAYFRPLIAERRAAHRDDVLGLLVAAEERGDVLDEHELLATCLLVLGAGHETTTNLIGNGMLALLRHPRELARLAAEPALLPNAIEELLRYDSPTQNQGRIALEDVDYGGRTIRRGQAVHCMINAANRDPEVFDRPDDLDIGRADIRHLSFGHGIHFCVGAPLARLEGRIAIGTLVARFPHMRLATARPTWSDSLTFRGVTTLPLAV